MGNRTESNEVPVNSNNNTNITPKNKEKKKFKIPTPYTIIFFLVVFVVLLTWILDWSNVSVTWTDSDNKTQVSTVTGAGIIDIFTAPFVAFVKKAKILVFILAVGAFSFIVMKSKSLDAVTQKLVKKMGDHSIWIIPIITVMLSFFGSTYGMCEESLGFLFVLCPLMLATGFDVITAVLMIILGVDLGTMMATTDPFLITPAVSATNEAMKQDIVAFADGLAFRLIAWVVITAFTIGYVVIYALRVKKNPDRSVVFADMEGHKQFFLHESVQEIPLTKKRIAIASIYLITFLVMIVYLVSWDGLLGFKDDIDHIETWGPMLQAQEWMKVHFPYFAGFTPGLGLGDLYYVSGIFFIASLMVGFLTWKGEDKFAEVMIDGAKDVLGVVFMISFAGAINVIFEASGMSAVAAHGLKFAGVNPYAFIIISYLVFIPISFAIPSSSGFATAIFPIWGPASNDVVLTGNITATSGSITAFSYASGWANLFSPATGLVMGACSIAKINYVQFLKALWPAIVITFILNIVLLTAGTGIDIASGIHIF
jgi:uncharacterized ion transporter superfamily protein YfcC